MRRVRLLQLHTILGNRQSSVTRTIYIVLFPPGSDNYTHPKVKGNTDKYQLTSRLLSWTSKMIPGKNIYNSYWNLVSKKDKEFKVASSSVVRDCYV